MRLNVKNTLIITLLYMASIPNGHAFNIDETVDDEIRKNYNPSQLIIDVSPKSSNFEKKIEQPTEIIDENLPALPNISKTQTYSEPLYDNITLNTKPYTGGNIKVKAGKTFNVENIATISDWQRKGTKVKFTTRGNTFGKQYTIPSGTIFQGEIIESHQPQISGNGGLVVIKIYSMIYKGQTIPVTAYVTKADEKKIFFNNIKGERKFMKTTWEKGKWGRDTFGKMGTISLGLCATGPTLILSPFPFAYGTLCLGISAITSPVCAFFSKGGHVSIPANSKFSIKLVEDVMID